MWLKVTCYICQSWKGIWYDMNRHKLCEILKVRGNAVHLTEVIKNLYNTNRNVGLRKLEGWKSAQ